MDWFQVMAIAGSTIGACWLMHRENVKMHQDFTDKFSTESKDFHGRLCKLEERYLQLMQKMWENR